MKIKRNITLATLCIFIVIGIFTLCACVKNRTEYFDSFGESGRRDGSIAYGQIEYHIGFSDLAIFGSKKNEDGGIAYVWNDLHFSRCSCNGPYERGDF